MSATGIGENDRRKLVGGYNATKPFSIQRIVLGVSLEIDTLSKVRELRVAIDPVEQSLRRWVSANEHSQRVLIRPRRRSDSDLALCRLRGRRSGLCERQQIPGIASESRCFHLVARWTVDVLSLDFPGCTLVDRYAVERRVSQLIVAHSTRGKRSLDWLVDPEGLLNSRSNSLAHDNAQSAKQSQSHQTERKHDFDTLSPTRAFLATYHFHSSSTALYD